MVINFARAGPMSRHRGPPKKSFLKLIASPVDSKAATAIY